METFAEQQLEVAKEQLKMTGNIQAVLMTIMNIQIRLLEKVTDETGLAKYYADMFNKNVNIIYKAIDEKIRGI